MKLDALLQSLASLPRPTLSPFFSARTTALAHARPRVTRSRAMAVYWTLLLLAGGPMLLTSWQRVAGVAVIALLLRVIVVLTPASARSR